MLSFQDYVHRVGRTSRGEGHVGQALLFLRPEEYKFLDVLRGMQAKIDEIEFTGDLNHIQDKVSRQILL